MARQCRTRTSAASTTSASIDGHTFLSMEYVDGEDLASLLRRIGRFSGGSGARARAPDLRRAGRRARARRRASRLEAGQRHARRQRARSASPTSASRGSSGEVAARRHARLHGARAARRSGSHGPQRHLRSRPGAVRSSSPASARSRPEQPRGAGRQARAVGHHAADRRSSATSIRRIERVDHALPRGRLRRRGPASALRSSPRPARAAIRSPPRSRRAKRRRPRWWRRPAPPTSVAVPRALGGRRLVIAVARWRWSRSTSACMMINRIPFPSRRTCSSTARRRSWSASGYGDDTAFDGRGITIVARLGPLYRRDVHGAGTGGIACGDAARRPCASGIARVRARSFPSATRIRIDGLNPPLTVSGMSLAWWTCPAGCRSSSPSPSRSRQPRGAQTFSDWPMLFDVAGLQMSVVHARHASMAPVTVTPTAHGVGRPACRR